LCGGCAKEQNLGTKISPLAYNFLVSLVESKAALEDAARPADGGKTIETAELRGLLNAYIMYHSESKHSLRASSMIGLNS